MKLNHYDPISGVYTHTTNAQENPRDEGKYFEQLNSTFDETPQLKSGEAAKRDVKNNQWLVVEDYRGKIWDTTTKEQSELTEIGPIPEGKTNLEPGEFDTWNDRSWIKDISAELKSTKINAIKTISLFAADARRFVAGEADHYQTAGWSDKRARAMRIKQGTPETDDIEIVQHEAAKRDKGESVTQLVDVQLSKAKKFALATYDIDGMQRAAEDKINAVKDVEEIPELLAALKAEAEQQLAVLMS